MLKHSCDLVNYSDFVFRYIFPKINHYKSLFFNRGFMCNIRIFAFMGQLSVVPKSAVIKGNNIPISLSAANPIYTPASYESAFTELRD